MMILTLLKVKRVILVMMSLPGPSRGWDISQSQDDSLTVEEVQLGPGDGRLNSLSNEDFLALTNTIELLCIYSNIDFFEGFFF